MENPLINLEKLSEPLTKLVHVTAAGIGTLYRPFGTVRQAKADSKAKIISSKTGAEVLSLEQRAKFRLEHREALRQENIEKVVLHAAHEMPATTSKDSVDNDWILQFFDHAQDVCNEKMQILWAKILAGEVAEPGKFSKRTLQFVKTINKFEAEMFTGYCSFAFQFDNAWCFIFEGNVTKELMIEKLGKYALTEHFASIGPLSSDSSAGSCTTWDKQKFNYFSQNYEAYSIADPPSQKRLTRLDLPFSFRTFSQIGQELFSISGAGPIDGYPEKISSYLEKDVKLSFKKYGVTP